jgi:hypothetical protein
MGLKEEQDAGRKGANGAMSKVHKIKDLTPYSSIGSGIGH